MIGAKVDDVLVRASDTDPKRLASFGRVIVLKEKHGERVLPIWSGPPEADLGFMSRGEGLNGTLPHRSTQSEVMGAGDWRSLTPDLLRSIQQAL